MQALYPCRTIPCCNRIACLNVVAMPSLIEHPYSERRVEEDSKSSARAKTDDA